MPRQHSQKYYQHRDGLSLAIGAHIPLYASIFGIGTLGHYGVSHAANIVVAFGSIEGIVLGIVGAVAGLVMAFD